MALETTFRIEPCLLDTINAELADLIANLSSAAERLGGRLHPATGASLADLVRLMNCYYSNLIEGHNTMPRDIESALANHLAEAEERRNLQIEARAHIRVQQTIDQQFQQGVLPEPASVDFIRWLHQTFYQDAPASMLKMVPGEFRHNAEQEVSVGRHLPPSSDKVSDFMAYFSHRYQFANLGKSSRIIVMAAAHHRLNYIHPFPDGNGRVSRLMSHAMGLHASIGAHGLWSISRGLARGLASRLEYKQMMDYADTPRQGDLDGRGNLSLKALVEFVTWFVKICLDQVTFMTELFDLDNLLRRLQLYCSERDFKPEAFFILEAVLIKGELARGEVNRVCNLKERAARTLLAQLIQDGILGSTTPKGPVLLRFPLKAVDVLFPNLLPSK